jgi:hypothetical protein
MVAGGMAATLAATAAVTMPSAGQAAPEEVGEVSGGAYAAFVEVRSDLLVLPSPSAIQAMVQAAADEEPRQAAAALADTDLEAVASAPSEAVLAGVGPVPEVVLPPTGGGPFTDDVASVDVDGLPVASVGEVETEGAIGAGGFARSAATLADLDVLGLFGADLVETTCAADLDGVSGTTALTGAGGIVSGAFPDDPAPNTLSPFNIDITIPILPDGTTLTAVYRTILNEQVTTPDSITVNGMHTLLSLRADPEGPDAGDPELVLIELESIFSQASCGAVAAEVVEPPTGPVPATPSFTG